MKRLFLIAVVLASFLTVQSAQGATYDVLVKKMMADKCAEYAYVCDNLSPQYVQATQDGNSWWLSPTMKKSNAKFPNYAVPLTLDEVTRYAIVRAWGIAIEAKDACEKTVIRDFKSHGKYPTAEDLKPCDYPNSQDWWVTQYPYNVEQTRADFDVSPEVFKVNEWAERRFWKENIDYRPQPN